MNGPRTYASKNIVGPPGIPDGPLTALRDSLAAGMADEVFASKMQKFTGIRNNFTDGKTAQKELIATTEAFLANKTKIDELTDMVFDKYVK